MESDTCLGTKLPTRYVCDSISQANDKGGGLASVVVVVVVVVVVIVASRRKVTDLFHLWATVDLSSGPWSQVCWGRYSNYHTLL